MLLQGMDAFSKNLHIVRGDESEYTILLLLTFNNCYYNVWKNTRYHGTMVIPHYAEYPPYNKHMSGTGWRLLRKVWQEY